ncbi:MAG TPA: ATP-binding protein, partial [Niastella sp.]
RNDRESIAKKVFERIAREGRKYGISLLISSQRPSELSKTVLSQCNSFIIHRLQNPEDQKYVRQLVSVANEDILQQLPILPQQHVVIMGDAVRTPVQARMNTANPRPNSNNPKFIENWTMKLANEFPNYFKIAEAWEKGEKYIPNQID